MAKETWETWERVLLKIIITMKITPVMAPEAVKGAWFFSSMTIRWSISFVYN